MGIAFTDIGQNGCGDNQIMNGTARLGSVPLMNLELG